MLGLTDQCRAQECIVVVVERSEHSVCHALLSFAGDILGNWGRGDWRE